MKMRCSKCGVVFEGPVDKCPNCGVVFKKPAAAPAANPAPAEESKPGNSVVVNVYNGNTNNGNAPAEEVKKSYWDGHLIQLIGWQLLTGFLVLITLGIMVPWRVCKLHGWHCKHSVYDGYRLTLVLSNPVNIEAYNELLRIQNLQI